MRHALVLLGWLALLACSLPVSAHDPSILTDRLRSTPDGQFWFVPFDASLPAVDATDWVQQHQMQDWTTTVSLQEVAQLPPAIRTLQLTKDVDQDERPNPPPPPVVQVQGPQPPAQAQDFAVETAIDRARRELTLAQNELEMLRAQLQETRLLLSQLKALLDKPLASGPLEPRAVVPVPRGPAPGRPPAPQRDLSGLRP